MARGPAGVRAAAVVFAWVAVAAGAADLAPVSSWTERRIAGVAPAQVSRVRDGDATVLQVRASAASGGASVTLEMEAAQRPILSWRWKVDRVVQGADLSKREGDDFAARVYVFFDVPEEELPFATRVKMALARLVHGETLPTAALCYVWDNRHPPGTTAWNPYTDRVRMIVVESGPARAGQWVEARRDVEADFRAAFGARGGAPVPAVTGIAAGVDTDQTGETATGWFGDFRMEPRR
jgi:hypothetical protein